MKTGIMICFGVLLSIIMPNAYPKPQELEADLVKQFERLKNESLEHVKENLCDSIAQVFAIGLSSTKTHEYEFPALKKFMGRISSKDKKINIFTWNLALPNGTFKYFGIVQYRFKKDSVRASILNDFSDSISAPEMITSSKNEWYGALYYELAELKVKGQKYYMLLGADLNNWISKKKIIEPLYFDKNYEPVLGKPMIKHNGKLKNRIIFEYSAQSSMVLHYDDKIDKIIFHRLEPINPKMGGSPEFLGASLLFDALIKKGDYLKIQRNIKLKNKE